MRVYELAKKLGMESKELIAVLKKMHIAVSSHSSTIDEDVAKDLLVKLKSRTEKTTKTTSKSSTRKASSSKKTDGKKAAKDSQSKSSSVSSEEVAKPEKRRILIKRKKTEEELSAASSEEENKVEGTSPEREPSSTTGVPPLEEKEAPVALSTEAGLPTPSSELSVPSQVSPVLDEKPGVAETGSVVGVPPTPTLESTEGGESKGGRKKPAVPESGGEGGLSTKDKPKKAKKTGRVKDADDLRFREDAARWQDLRAIPVHRREDRSRHVTASAPTEITKPRKKVIKLTTGLTVKEFAELIGQRPTDIIRQLMETGEMKTLNHPMDPDAAVLIAESLGLKVELSAEKQGEELLEEVTEVSEQERPEPRPPVVTIMGHVDHGKTSLLDAIRKANVTEQEAGGITQHIGAYTVDVGGKRVTFLDTPGHEAFTSMRARGAQVTDLVVLVVAADDGVMPQTVEAINHAIAGNAPIIVAVNKIDKPGVNADRVKTALAEHNLIPEAWGGTTIFVEVSAKENIGLDTLLEMILLQAEVLELKADPYGQAKGSVIEAKLDKGRGPVATVLVQSGTLRVGDAFLVGTFSGKVRALVSDTGNKLKEAGPSIPVEVVGLPGVPSAGDQFLVVKNEKVAKEIAADRMQKQRTAELASLNPRVSLDDLFSQISEGDIKELGLVIKADVQGSAEALSQAIEKLSSDAVKLRVLHRGIGGITETDVMLASSSRAIVVGFNVRPESKAASLAEKQNVDIRLYTVIYDAVANIKAAMEGLLEPTIKERSLGQAEVRQVFTIPKIGAVAGCYVLEGTISRSSAGVRVVRDHVNVFEGKLSSLKRFKDDVRDVQQGYECGISVENFNDIKVGDVLEVFVLDKIAATL